MEEVDYLLISFSYIVHSLIRFGCVALLVLAVSVIVQDLLSFFSRWLSSDNGVRHLLTFGCVLAVYLLYLTACAAVQSAGFALFVLPFFGQMNADGLGLLINICGVLALSAWVLWALLYNRNHA